MITGKRLFFILIFFISLFSMISPRQAFASNCPCSGIMGANCGNGGYTTCSCTCDANGQNCTANYGCHPVGGGGGGGCTTCNGCNTSDGCGMFSIISTSVARTSPTSAVVSWVPDQAPGSCDGDGGDVFVVVMTNPDMLWTTKNDTCSGTQTVMCGYPGAKEVPNCPPGYPNCGTVSQYHKGKNGHPNCTDNYNLAPGCSFILDLRAGGPQNFDYRYSYETIDGLDPNTVYYIAVVPSAQQGYCSTQSPTPFVTSCSLIPSTSTVPEGSSEVLTNTIASNPNISNVTFSQSSNYFSFNPASTSDAPYQTLVTGIKSSYGAPQTVSSDVYLKGYPGSQSQCTTTIAVLPPPVADPWWQVKDSDVASNGDLKSKIPDFNGEVFDLPGNGGYAGVPAYAGNTNLKQSLVSANGWLANSANTNPKVYNSAFFNNQMPSGTLVNSLPGPSISQSDIDSGTIDPGTGYYWFKYDGSASGLDLTTIEAINIGSKKVILLVNSANFDIDGNINLTKGQGFFLVSAGEDTNGNKGNIVVDPSVGGGESQNLEGLYIADNLFKDGTNEPGTVDSQLWIRGSVVAYGGTSLNRNLGGLPNITSPAELFEYAPDQIMLYPKALSAYKINWKEVAP